MESHGLDIGVASKKVMFFFAKSTGLATWPPSVIEEIEDISSITEGGQVARPYKYKWSLATPVSRLKYESSNPGITLKRTCSSSTFV